jgi:hypothetical protein
MSRGVVKEVIHVVVVMPLNSLYRHDDIFARDFFV